MKRRSMAIFAGGLLTLAGFGGAAGASFEERQMAYAPADYVSWIPYWAPYSTFSGYEKCSYYRNNWDYFDCVVREFDEDRRILMGNIRTVVRSPRTATSDQWMPVIFIVAVFFAFVLYRHMNYNRW